MKGEPKHSLTAILIAYLLFVLVLSGLLTGGSYLLLFLTGFIPGFLLSHFGMPVLVILMVILFSMMISVFTPRLEERGPHIPKSVI